MPRNKGNQKHLGSRYKKKKKTSFYCSDEEQATVRRGLRMLDRLIARTQATAIVNSSSWGSGQEQEPHPLMLPSLSDFNYQGCDLDGP